MNPFTIMKEVENAYNIKQGSICASSRSKTIVRARWMAASLIREYTQFSYPEIGELLEKHHSSIMHGIESFNELLHSDEFTTRKMEYVKNVLNNSSK